MLIPIDRLPRSRLQKKSDNIIAFGEETGHKHWFDTPNPVIYEDVDGTIYVDLVEHAPLLHTGSDNEPVWTKEEAKQKDLHIAHMVRPGTYIVRRERDIEDPLTNQSHLVAD